MDTQTTGASRIKTFVTGEGDAPRPQEDEVRLKVLCCGICRTDIHIIEGDLPLKKSPVILELAQVAWQRLMPNVGWLKMSSQNWVGSDGTRTAIAPGLSIK